jgi:hypothetical protein
MIGLPKVVVPKNKQRVFRWIPKEELDEYDNICQTRQRSIQERWAYQSFSLLSEVMIPKHTPRERPHCLH